MFELNTLENRAEREEKINLIMKNSSERKLIKFTYSLTPGLRFHLHHLVPLRNLLDNRWNLISRLPTVEMSCHDS